MAIIKCKVCGGDLNLVEGASTAECEFCGSIQTIPKVDDEKKLTLFSRANRLSTSFCRLSTTSLYSSPHRCLVLPMADSQFSTGTFFPLASGS